jgi:hypothetical protein
MLPDYHDITSRIHEQPFWYDGHGTPRYGEFNPEALGVYDDAALLVEIECQSCSRRFLVAEGSSSMDRMRWAWEKARLAKDDRESEYLDALTWLARVAKSFHYGDPPRHEGCVGDTMNCLDRRIVQAWMRDRDLQFGKSWLRQPKFEGDMELPG